MFHYLKEEHLYRYSGLNQVGKYFFLERDEVFAHIGVANRGKSKTEYDAFAAFDQEADALHVGFVFTHTIELHKGAYQHFFQLVGEIFKKFL